MDLESIKVYTEITKPFIEAAVQTLVTPQLKRIGAWLKKQDTERKVDNLLWENKFSTYLENLHQSTSYISTLVFPNQQIQIK